MRLLRADWTFHEGTLVRDRGLALDSAGRIAANEPWGALRTRYPDAPCQERPGLAIVPGTVSAHSHAFQVLLRGAGDHPRSFKDWVDSRLYPLVGSLDDASLQAASELCFQQMARAGITSVGEFHYVHCGRGPQHAFRGLEQAQIVVDAARRVGLRITLLYTLYDVCSRPGQKRMAHEAAAGVAAAKALAERYADDPAVIVAPSPHSLHGATRGAIEAGAALARELDTPWHIHLAEQEDDVPFAREKHGARPLEVLEAWGILDARTVLVHGIWLSPEERALLAERGGSLVSNPTTNMALGDGIAALSDLVKRGVTVALGTDMNAAPNVFAELRCAEYLQRVEALKMGCIPRARAETPDPGLLFQLATRNGARVLGQETGSLAGGEWADYLEVDLSDPSLIPASLLPPDDPEAGPALLNLLSSALVPETGLAAVYVAGEEIAQRGRLLGLDSAELSARLRASRALRSSQ